MKIEIVIDLISCSNHNLGQTLFFYPSQTIIFLSYYFATAYCPKAAPDQFWGLPCLGPHKKKKRTNPFDHVADGNLKKKWRGDGLEPWSPQQKRRLPYHCTAPTFVLNLVLIFLYTCTRCKFGE